MPWVKGTYKNYTTCDFCGKKMLENDDDLTMNICNSCKKRKTRKYTKGFFI